MVAPSSLSARSTSSFNAERSFASSNDSFDFKRQAKLSLLWELKCVPPEPIPPAREPMPPPPPPPVGSQVSPAEDLFRSTSCWVEKLEKNEVSGDHLHEALSSAKQSHRPIEMVCLMELRSN